MSGFCSKHMGFTHPDCRLCNAQLPDWWAEESAKAKATGETKCAHCNFVRYNTVDYCPKCGKK